MSGKKFSLILVTFIVLAIAGGVFLYLNNPKIKFINLINKEYKAFALILNEAEESELATLSKSNPLVSTGDVSFTLKLGDNALGIDNSIIDLFNKIKINYEYGSDPKENNTYAYINSSVDNKELVNVQMIKMGNKQYIYYPGIFDKYIESNSNEYFGSKGNQTEDAMYLTDKIKESFVMALDTANFTVTNEQTDINNQILDTQKISLALKESRFKEIMIDVLTSLKNDEKSLAIIDEFTDPIDGKEKIDSIINYINSKVFSIGDYVIDIYAYKDTIAKVHLTNSITGNIVEYLSYTELYPVKELNFISDGQVAVKAHFEQKSADNLAYKITFKNDDNTIIANGTIAKAIESADNKIWNGEIAFNIALTYDESLLGSLNINAKTKTEIGAELNMKDVNLAKITTSLTDEENTEITNKMIEKIFNGFNLNTLPVAEEELEPQAITY